MDINIPKIVRPLELSGYAPELDGVRIYVWVNPPRALLAELVDRVAEDAEDVEARLRRAYEIISTLWSQGADAETHWTAAEVERLIREKLDTDPSLFPWLREQTFSLIAAHRNAQKKS